MSEVIESGRTQLGPFVIVPEWVVRSCSANALKLYCILYHYADRGSGKAWPSRPTLAADMGMSTKSIDRLLEELKGIGAVEVQHRKRPDGTYSSSMYTVQSIAPAHVKVASPMSLHRDTGDVKVGTPVSTEQEPLNKNQTAAAVDSNIEPSELISEAVRVVDGLGYSEARDLVESDPTEVRRQLDGWPHRNRAKMSNPAGFFVSAVRKKHVIPTQPQTGDHYRLPAWTEERTGWAEQVRAELEAIR